MTRATGYRKNGPQMTLMALIDAAKNRFQIGVNLSNVRHRRAMFLWAVGEIYTPRLIAAILCLGRRLWTE
jgi:hypothetical protein